MRLKSLLVAGSLLGAFFIPAHAQNLQVASPNVPGSSTISVTNTFQSVLVAANGSRFGCSIQNQGTATMYVFAGPIANATKATSKQLAPPSTGTITPSVFNCGSPGGPTLFRMRSASHRDL